MSNFPFEFGLSQSPSQLTSEQFIKESESLTEYGEGVLGLGKGGVMDFHFLDYYYFPTMALCDRPYLLICEMVR